MAWYSIVDPCLSLVSLRISSRGKSLGLHYQKHLGLKFQKNLGLQYLKNLGLQYQKKLGLQYQKNLGLQYQKTLGLQHQKKLKSCSIGSNEKSLIMTIKQPSTLNREER
jgi:hypothetical protein